MSDYLSMHVTGEPGAYRLMLREYASFDGPDYTTICSITNSQAATLTDSGLVTPWVGVSILEGEPVSEGILILRPTPSFPKLPQVVLNIPGLAEDIKVPITEPFLREVYAARSVRQPITTRKGLSDCYALS